MMCYFLLKRLRVTLRAGQKSTKISRKISSAKELAAEEDKGKLGKQNMAVAKITRKACF